MRTHNIRRLPAAPRHGGGITTDDPGLLLVTGARESGLPGHPTRHLGPVTGPRGGPRAQIPIPLLGGSETVDGVDQGPGHIEIGDHPIAENTIVSDQRDAHPLPTDRLEHGGRRAAVFGDESSHRVHDGLRRGDGGGSGICTHTGEFTDE